MADFQRIKIVGFDDASSGPSGEGALQRMMLTLSANPPHQWAMAFDQEWKNHFFMMKRKATTMGAGIFVTCMPDELQGLINELNKVIAKVNDAYEKALAQAAAAAEVAQAKQAEEQKVLKDLKGTLKFD